MVVVLAKSNKCNGYCIAGREVYLDNEQYCLGSWMRLVSSDKASNGAIFDRHLNDTKGKAVNVLDVVSVPVDKEQVVPGQPDNILIDESRQWMVEGQLDPTEIKSFVDMPKHLWQEDDFASHIVSSAKDDINYVPQSLYLIKPDNLVFTLSHEFNGYKGSYERKIRVSFLYAKQQYCNLAMTDPKVKKMLGRKYPQAGAEPVQMTLLKGDNYYLCVSLTPRFGEQQFHYKIVATVFDFDGYLQGHYH